MARKFSNKTIYRETFLSSLEVAHQALLRTGLGVSAAPRAVALLKQHDEAQLEIPLAARHDEAQLIETAQQAAAQLQELFAADAAGFERGGTNAQ